MRERVLEEGQRIFVLGTANPKPSSLEVSQDALDPADTDGPHERAIRALQQEAVGTIRRGDGQPRCRFRFTRMKTKITADAASAKITICQNSASFARASSIIAVVPFLTFA